LLLLPPLARPRGCALLARVCIGRCGRAVSPKVVLGAQRACAQPEETREVGMAVVSMEGERGAARERAGASLRLDVSGRLRAIVGHDGGSLVWGPVEFVQ